MPDEATILTVVWIALMVGHFSGDYVIQTDWQSTHKALGPDFKPSALVRHIVGYGAAQLVALAVTFWVADQPLPLVPVTAALAVSLGSHAVIDTRTPVMWLMRHTGSGPFIDRGGVFLVDQALHWLFIWAAALTAQILL